MKAVLSERPGPTDLLRVAEIEAPVVPDDGVLVRVRAASVNPVDLFSLTPAQHFMRRVAARGKRRPEAFGHDFAGTVTGSAPPSPGSTSVTKSSARTRVRSLNTRTSPRARSATTW